MKHSIDITGFQLKIAAIVAMTCNHVANVFGPLLPAPLNFVLYTIGGVTFPIMAFLLMEGYVHTSDLKKYALRLLLFALVAQIPYYLVFGVRGNVLFTLLIGLGILWLNGRFGTGIGLLATIVCTALLHSYLDWGTTGFVIIYMFGTLREAHKIRSSRQARSARSPQVLSQQDPPPWNALQQDSSESTIQQSPFQQNSLQQSLRPSQTSQNSQHLQVPQSSQALQDPSWQEDVSRETSSPVANMIVNAPKLEADAISDMDATSDVANGVSGVADTATDGVEIGLTKEERRTNVITIIGTMLIPMCVTCINGARYANPFTLGYALIGYTIATILLCFYRGHRGRSMKWFFYAYYPLHLFAIWLVATILQ